MEIRDAASCATLFLEDCAAHCQALRINAAKSVGQRSKIRDSDIR